MRLHSLLLLAFSGERYLTLKNKFIEMEKAVDVFAKLKAVVARLKHILFYLQIKIN